MYIRSVRILIMFLIFAKISHICATGQIYKTEAGHEYYIDFENKFSWLESQEECSKRDMILAEIKTKEKSLELIKLIKNVVENNSNITAQYLWTGGVREKFPADNFFWHSTDEKLNYSNWHSTSPTDNDQKSCIELVLLFDWKWRNYECSSNDGFICESSNEKSNQRKLKRELEKNLNLQNELENQKTVYEDQIQKLKETHVQEQETLKKNFQVEQDQLKQTLRSQQEHIKQLSDEQKETIGQLEAKLQLEIQKQQNLEQEMEKQQTMLDQLKKIEEQFQESDENSLEINKDNKNQTFNIYFYNYYK